MSSELIATPSVAPERVVDGRVDLEDAGGRVAVGLQAVVDHPGDLGHVVAAALGLDQAGDRHQLVRGVAQVLGGLLEAGVVGRLAPAVTIALSMSTGLSFGPHSRTSTGTGSPPGCRWRSRAGRAASGSSSALLNWALGKSVFLASSVDDVDHPQALGHGHRGLQQVGGVDQDRERVGGRHLLLQLVEARPGCLRPRRSAVRGVDERLGRGDHVGLGLEVAADVGDGVAAPGPRR